MVVGVLSRWWLQQLRGKPENPLGLVSRHQLHHEGLEISEDFDLRQGFFFYWIHSIPQTGKSPTQGTKKLRKRSAARSPARGAAAVSYNIQAVLGDERWVRASHT
jgi:hypothetical protein